MTLLPCLWTLSCHPHGAPPRSKPRAFPWRHWSGQRPRSFLWSQSPRFRSESLHHQDAARKVWGGIVTDKADISTIQNLVKKFCDIINLVMYHHPYWSVFPFWFVVFLDFLELENLGFYLWGHTGSERVTNLTSSQKVILMSHFCTLFTWVNSFFMDWTDKR